MLPQCTTCAFSPRSYITNLCSPFVTERSRITCTGVKRCLHGMDQCKVIGKKWNSDRQPFIWFCQCFVSALSLSIDARLLLVQWNHTILQSKGVSISNLLEDLSDGTVLSQLLQELSGEKMPRLKPGTMRIQKLANLNTVFTFLRNYVKLVDIGPQDVLDGNETRVLGMLWSIISVFSIRSVNLTMPGVRHMGDLKNRLIMWGQKNAEAKSSNGFWGRRSLTKL